MTDTTQDISVEQQYEEAMAWFPAEHARKLDKVFRTMSERIIILEHKVAALQTQVAALTVNTTPSTPSQSATPSTPSTPSTPTNS